MEGRKDRRAARRARTRLTNRKGEVGRSERGERLERRKQRPTIALQIFRHWELGQWRGPLEAAKRRRSHGPARLAAVPSPGGPKSPRNLPGVSRVREPSLVPRLTVGRAPTGGAATFSVQAQRHLAALLVRVSSVSLGKASRVVRPFGRPRDSSRGLRGDRRPFGRACVCVRS
jgi:hypothetical protein